VRIATIAEGRARRAVLVDAERGIIPIDVALPGFSGDAMAVLEPATYQAAVTAAKHADDTLFLDTGEVTFVAPYPTGDAEPDRRAPGARGDATMTVTLHDAAALLGGVAHHTWVLFT
jgi:hypothetical protein